MDGPEATHLAFVFIAFYGAGWEADGWCLVLLALGLVVYAVMRALNSRGSIPEAAPAQPS